MVWHVNPTKTYCSSVNVFREMKATCQDDRVAPNCFKRGNMHMCYAEEWSVVVGGVGGWGLTTDMHTGAMSQDAALEVTLHRAEKLLCVSHSNLSYSAKRYN